MARQIELYVYEVLCHPVSKAGVPVPNETGRSIRTERIAAPSQHIAEQMAAQRNKGWIIVETIRLDGVKPPKAPRAPRRRKVDLSSLPITTGAALLAKQAAKEST
jgi:hypothetical protein